MVSGTRNHTTYRKAGALMMKGDIYEHYKGNEYIFYCITNTIANDSLLYANFLATHTETKEDIVLSRGEEGILFTDGEPLVIYCSVLDPSVYWARPVDMFFGSVGCDESGPLDRFCKTGERFPENFDLLSAADLNFFTHKRLLEKERVLMIRKAKISFVFGFAFGLAATIATYYMLS